MSRSFTTRQFRAGNSQAVRLPADIAFPPKTDLVVVREGEKIIVQPLEKSMENIPQLFASLKKHVIGEEVTRPEFIDSGRNWGSDD